jgi:hypothetical protein
VREFALQLRDAGPAQKHRTIQVGVAFKNRRDIDKALERFESKHRSSLYFCTLLKALVSFRTSAECIAPAKETL